MTLALNLEYVLIIMLGLYSLKRSRLTRIGIPIINLRWSSNHHRFIMGIPIPIKHCLLSKYRISFSLHYENYKLTSPTPQIARFMRPTWGPPGSCRPKMGPMLAPWTLLSGTMLSTHPCLFLSISNTYSGHISLPQKRTSANSIMASLAGLPCLMF